MRIALNLAGLSYESRSIDLVAGEQNSAEHIKRNAQGFVPVLEIDGQRLTQSLSIIEYLDETRSIGLLPNDVKEKACVRALAQIIACDIHPVCNLSVAAFAAQSSSDPDDAKKTWMQHFIRKGLVAYEQTLALSSSPSQVDDKKPTIAELCLIPQLYNARRWSVQYDDLIQISNVENAYADQPAFKNAAPTEPR